MTLLQQGMTGAAVVQLQKALGLKPDGDFGPATHNAVMSFQRLNGLKPDGIVGDNTWRLINNAQGAAGFITLERLKAVFPKGDLEILKLLPTLPLSHGVGPDSLRMFIAQAGHESGDFRTFTENLNYSANGLANTWPSRYARKDAKGRYLKQKDPRNSARMIYVPTAMAGSLANRPREIANLTYGDRNGNRGVNTNDGWDYRGRGIFQLTGRGNYALFDQAYPEFNALNNPDVVSTPRAAVVSAAWYWGRNRLDRYATNVADATKIINGGTIGLAHRESLYNNLA